MLTKSVLITGCNRGIGLALVKRLASETQYLFAGCRNPDKAEELKKVAGKFKNVIILELDVSCQASIEAAKDQISGIVGDQGLNCLINNAAQIINSDNKIDEVNAEDMMRLYKVNSVSPLMMSKTFLPLLRTASKAFPNNNEMSIERAAIVNVGGMRGSIEKCDDAGMYCYKMSKTALHMFSKTLSNELISDSIAVIIIHPGWVQTDMGGADAPVTIDESINGIMSILSSINKENNGRFLAWDGSYVPW